MRNEQSVSPESITSRIDVRDISKRFGCLITHGLFEDTGKPGFRIENEMLNKVIDWKDSLKIVLSFNPDISCSSFRIDSNDWIKARRYGIFLRDGQIKFAGIGDLHSIARGFNNREVGANEIVTEDLIKKVIEKKDEESNEIGISYPEVAGFYVKKTTAYNQTYYPVPDGLRQIAEKIKMPIYFVDENEIYTATYRYFVVNKDYIPIAEVGSDLEKATRREMTERFPDGETLVSGYYKDQKISVEAILENGPVVTNEIKERLKKDIMDDGILREDITG